MAEAVAAEKNGSAEAPATAAFFAGMKAQVRVAAARAEEAVAFYKAAFGAEELSRATHPKRKADGDQQPPLLCAEIKIGAGAGAGLFVCADDSVAAGMEGPGAGGIMLRLETADVQAAVGQAVQAGAALQGEIAEDDGSCCGSGPVAKLVDPFGVTWVVASAASAKKCAADATATTATA